MRNLLNYLAGGGIGVVVAVFVWWVSFLYADWYNDWEKKKEDIKHNLTLAERRAFASEYIHSKSKIASFTSDMYADSLRELYDAYLCNYENDSVDSVAVDSAYWARKGSVIKERRHLTDSLINELKSCLYSKFYINDSIFQLISAEYTETITAELEELKKKQASQKGKKYELDASYTAAWFYWNYSDFKEPECLPFLFTR